MSRRASQIARAAKQAFWASRRPRRAKIVMVPAAHATPEHQAQRPVLVPYTPRPLDWEAARECGKAYGRVLDGAPKYDRDFEERQRRANIRAAEHRQKAKNKPKPPRIARDPRGTWWMNHLADVVDRRKVITVPSYSRRYEPKETPPAPVKEDP